jgi:predicted LPLAT superfamily acyltransferase
VRYAVNMADPSAPKPASGWLRYGERGSVFAYWLISRIALLLGRPLTRLLLYPICLYYMAFNRATVHASREYLRRILGRRPRFTEVFRHHLTFAAVLLDRAYFYAGQLQHFDLRLHGSEQFVEVMERGRGCLMLSAHLGSSELVRATGMRHELVVNMLMYEENARKLATFINTFHAAAAPRRIIPIGRVDTLIIAKERLDAGEVVGILADRVVGTERTVHVPFLGAPAVLPAGPFLAASVLGVPVVMFVCLYHGGNRYDLYLETLADHIQINRRHPEEIENWARRYTERLEHYCRLAPYNWFNFYDYWAEPAEIETHATPATRDAA